MAIMDNGKPSRVEKKSVRFEAQRDDPLRFDQELLSEEEKEDLRAKARAAILEEQKKKLSDALYAKYIDEERKAHDPAKQTVPILIQLAGHASYILLDHMMYRNDTVYHVTSDVAAVLIEQMNRGWAHEELTEVRENKSRRRWHAPPGIGFGNYMDNRVPRDMVMSSAQLASTPTESLLGVKFS